MARRVKPKIQYKKNKKIPKAFLGSIVRYFGGRKQRKMGEEQLKRGQQAMDAFDQSRLESRRTASKAARKMADAPIDQGYVERLEDSQLASQATAMRNLSRDPRAALAGTMGLQRQARLPPAQEGRNDLDSTGHQDLHRTPKTSAHQKDHTEQHPAGHPCDVRAAAGSKEKD